MKDDERDKARALGFVSDCGFVYLIGYVHDSHVVKIGWAKNPMLRIRTLRTANESAIALLSFVPGDRHQEAALHRKFGALRVRGEWFLDSDCAISDLFKSLEAVWGR